MMMCLIISAVFFQVLFLVSDAQIPIPLQGRKLERINWNDTKCESTDIIWAWQNCLHVVDSLQVVKNAKDGCSSLHYMAACTKLRKQKAISCQKASFTLDKTVDLQTFEYFFAMCQMLCQYNAREMKRLFSPSARCGVITENIFWQTFEEAALMEHFMPGETVKSKEFMCGKLRNMMDRGNPEKNACSSKNFKKNMKLLIDVVFRCHISDIDREKDFKFGDGKGDDAFFDGFEGPAESLTTMVTILPLESTTKSSIEEDIEIAIGLKNPADMITDFITRLPASTANLTKATTVSTSTQLIQVTTSTTAQTTLASTLQETHASNPTHMTKTKVTQASKPTLVTTTKVTPTSMPTTSTTIEPTTVITSTIQPYMSSSEDAQLFTSTTVEPSTEAIMTTSSEILPNIISSPASTTQALLETAETSTLMPPLTRTTTEPTTIVTPTMPATTPTTTKSTTSKKPTITRQPSTITKSKLRKTTLATTTTTESTTTTDSPTTTTTTESPTTTTQSTTTTKKPLKTKKPIPATTSTIKTTAITSSKPTRPTKRHTKRPRPTRPTTSTTTTSTTSIPTMATTEITVEPTTEITVEPTTEITIEPASTTRVDFDDYSATEYEREIDEQNLDIESATKTIITTATTTKSSYKDKVAILPKSMLDLSKDKLAINVHAELDVKYEHPKRENDDMQEAKSNATDQSQHKGDSSIKEKAETSVKHLPIIPEDFVDSLTTKKCNAGKSSPERKHHRRPPVREPRELRPRSRANISCSAWWLIAIVVVFMSS